MKKLFKFLLIIIFVISCSDDTDEIIPVSDPIILSFSIKEIEDTFFINTTNNTIETTLQQDKDLKNLTAVFSVPKNVKVFIGNTLQVSGFTKNDFTNSVRYIVQNEEGKKITYTISITPNPSVYTFKMKELPEINFTIDKTSINAKVPSGTNLSSLTAEFELSKNTSLFLNDELQVSGITKNDFSNPVNYILKSANGNSKTISVTITTNPNNLPVADAGENSVIILPSSQSSAQVILDGSKSSDIDGPISKFEWILNGNIIGNTKYSSVSLSKGIHHIQLIVTDTSNATATDTVTIEVRQQGTYIPIDNDVTEATRKLFQKLGDIADGSTFIFGQEFPMSFQLNNLRTNLNTSDCKDVVGDHPGVFGIDPHYMLYKGAQQKQLHINEAKFAYENGGIITFDFHQKSKTDGKIYFDEMTSELDKSLVYDIVNNLNNSRSWFYNELDAVLDIINNDLGFPVVFRLFHEMDGDWFWWGIKTKNHSPELYKQLYKIAVNYIKPRTKLVLFGWSPNQSVKEEYYPGDDYVDFIGIDVYNPSKSTLKDRLISLTNFSNQRGKVAILSETGYKGYINENPKFWTDIILKSIEEGGSAIKIAWVLSWFNAPWSSSQSDLFIPNKNSSAAVKENFINFYNSPITLFLEETKSLKVYE